MSQTDEDKTAARIALLEDIAIRGKTPSRKDVVDTGLDVEILETIADEIKSGIHYMLGWQPLERWFRTPPRSHHRDNLLPYGHMLAEKYDRDRRFVHPQTRLLVEFGFRYKDREGFMPISQSEKDRYRYTGGEPVELHYRICRLRILYTKTGEWIVWASWPESTFRECKTLKDMLQAVRDLTPERFHLFDPKTNTINIDSVPLYLCEALEKFQQDSMDARKSLSKTDEFRAERLCGIRRRFGLRPPPSPQP